MATKFRYVGPPRLTRGEYGERVTTVFRLRETEDGRWYTPHPEGDVLGVWDSAFGWRPWMSWDAALDEGIVGEPLD